MMIKVDIADIENIISLLERFEETTKVGTPINTKIKDAIYGLNECMEDCDEDEENEDEELKKTFMGEEDEKQKEEPKEIQIVLDVLVGIIKKQNELMVQGAASDQIKINAAELVLNYFSKKEY